MMLITAARVAIEAGADALGFILAPSKRQIAAQEIAEIREALSAGGRTVPSLVGVTVNATKESIEQWVRDGELDMIQLSGDESVSMLAVMDVPVIKALRFPADTSPDDALREVDAWLSGPRPAARVIVEGHADGSYGGTGARADWELVARIAGQYSIVLAGGLDPENVMDAVSTVRPSGVDVSSGTETNGVKDHDKIRAFLRNARAAADLQISLKG